MELRSHPCSLLSLADSLRPLWATEQILRFDDEKFRSLSPYVSSHHWQAEGSLNVYRVIGTRHPDYPGMTWREFLERGKRMATINRPLWEQNPNYYEGTGLKEPRMGFITLDGVNWYVDDDGNHRTCIARFHFAKGGRSGWFHGVGLADWRFDTEFGAALESARKISDDRRCDLELEHKLRCVKREDGPTWKLDHFENRARLKADPFTRLPKGFTHGELLDTRNLLRLAEGLKAPTWRRWFRVTDASFGDRGF